MSTSIIFVVLSSSKDLISIFWTPEVTMCLPVLHIQCHWNNVTNSPPCLSIFKMDLKTFIGEGEGQSGWFLIFMWLKWEALSWLLNTSGYLAQAAQPHVVFHQQRVLNSSDRPGAATQRWSLTENFRHLCRYKLMDHERGFYLVIK